MPEPNTNERLIADDDIFMMFLERACTSAFSGDKTKLVLAHTGTKLLSTHVWKMFVEWAVTLERANKTITIRTVDENGAVLSVDGTFEVVFADMVVFTRTNTHNH